MTFSDLDSPSASGSNDVECVSASGWTVVSPRATCGSTVAKSTMSNVLFEVVVHWPQVCEDSYEEDKNVPQATADGIVGLVGSLQVTQDEDSTATILVRRSGEPSVVFPIAERVELCVETGLGPDCEQASAE